MVNIIDDYNISDKKQNNNDDDDDVNDNNDDNDLDDRMCCEIMEQVHTNARTYVCTCVCVAVHTHTYTQFHSFGAIGEVKYIK